MKFFLNISPPRATAQEKQVRIMPNGRPVFFDNRRVKEARALLTEALKRFAPAAPMEGPVALTSTWYYPTSKKKQDGLYKITRPDTDNLQKLLKDCMTAVGFWKDDAQVVSEHVEKRWSVERPGIEITITAMKT